MAGVYFANMKLPAVCDECLSGFVQTIGCTKRLFFNDRNIARHPDCPLHFVPDHGRLIDADALASEIQKFLDEEGDGWMARPIRMAQRATRVAILTKIKNAPTIIPPEDEIAGEDTEQK